MLGRIAVFICSFLLIANLTADTFSTPTGQVRDSVERVLKILKDTTLDRDQKWEKIGVIINERFDFRSMSQSILATNWKRATPEEREKFVEYFSQAFEFFR